MQTSHSPLLPGSLPISHALSRSSSLFSIGCLVPKVPQRQVINRRRGLSRCCASCGPNTVSKSATWLQHKHAGPSAFQKFSSSTSTSSRVQLKRRHAAISDPAVDGSIAASSVLTGQPLGPAAEPDVLHNRCIRGMQQRAKRHRGAPDSAAVLHKALNVSSTQELTVGFFVNARL